MNAIKEGPKPNGAEAWRSLKELKLGVVGLVVPRGGESREDGPSVDRIVGWRVPTWAFGDGISLLERIEERLDEAVQLEELDEALAPLRYASSDRVSHVLARLASADAMTADAERETAALRTEVEDVVRWLFERGAVALADRREATMRPLSELLSERERIVAADAAPDGDTSAFRFDVEDVERWLSARDLLDRGADEGPKLSEILDEHEREILAAATLPTNEAVEAACIAEIGDSAWGALDDPAKAEGRVRVRRMLVAAAACLGTREPDGVWPAALAARRVRADVSGALVRLADAPDVPQDEGDELPEVTGSAFGR